MGSYYADRDVVTSGVFTVSGDFTLYAELDNGGLNNVDHFAFVPASGTRSTGSTLRKSVRTELPSADVQTVTAKAPARTQATAYPVDMSPEELQSYLAEQGAVPYGDEITVTRGDDWTATVSELPRRQGYTEYTYYVVELDPDGSGWRLVGYDGEGTDRVTVTNQTYPTSFELPVTGGTGPTRHTIAGIALLLAAFVLAYTKLRRRKLRSGEGGPDG